MEKHSIRVAACAALAVAFFSGVRTTFAQVGPDGIDWVTIGAVNNPAYDGPDPMQRVRGRGSVPYEYRIGRFEVTTAQWMELYNTFRARPDPVSELIIPGNLLRGAERDPTYPGPGERLRLRTDIPNAGMVPVGGIDWRTAARLCNWLHNDKSPAHSALENGAYDTTTFGYDGPNFTDQLTRSPGARYWIPSFDEWLKSVHFDPTANGGAGRWWQQPNGSDTPLIYGPPPGYPNGSPLNQANAGFALPGFAHELIPLGSYPTVVSPWGLLDAAGANSEWTEEAFFFNGQRIRVVDGTQVVGGPNNDLVYRFSGHGPAIPEGFRIASAVPTPGMVAMLSVSAWWGSRRRRTEAFTCQSRSAESRRPS